MSDNIPPSQMLRVPTPLVDAVKELSRLHRAGYTSAVLTGLQQLVATIDSSADIDNNSSGNQIDTALIAELISSQLEPLQLQLEQSVQVLVAKYLTAHSENLRLRTGNLSDLIEPLHRRLSQVDQRLQLVESTTESAVISTEVEKPAVVVYDLKDLSLEKTISDNLPAEVEIEEPAVVEAIAGTKELISATELAPLLGVTQPTVSRAANNLGHEKFRKWSSKQKGSAGTTWDFILVKKGGKEVPQFFQVTDTPSV